MKITEALAAEHTIFLSVFEQIEKALPSLSTPVEVQRMAAILEGLLRGHAARETDLAYAALDHVLAEQGQLERMCQEHHEIDARLKSVQVAGNCAEARRLLKASILASREHFQLEEQNLFPLLEKVLQPETLDALGRGWAERDGVKTP